MVFLQTCSVVTESVPTFELKLRSGLSNASPNHLGSLSSNSALSEFSSVILFSVQVSLEMMLVCVQSLVPAQSILSPEHEARTLVR